MNTRPPWLDWATELQSLAQAGLAYSKDPFDIERFTRIRAIAADILHHHTDLPAAKIRDLFCNETGYQTPKLGVRAAIINDAAQILLVQENDGQWALPGGWADINHSIGENAAKETKEETGLDVIPERLIAVQDYARHHPRPHAHTICNIHILCRATGGAFRANNETLASAWFGEGDLPPLDESKTTAAHIALCYAAWRDPHWQPPFD
ncbi:NUDIX hydrolase [uncultured Cardiobacterium sp.]|uniref:NUDIX hydrolase n=1 Tax=uncultured Cardiobacterium sp. TaxID=417619 RepID=UPI0026032C8D|nr:NUDIX hydrolase [uncultured Cardiobacterium sp.]